MSIGTNATDGQMPAIVKLGNDVASSLREKFLDRTLRCTEREESTLHLYGKSIKYGANGPRIHVRDLVPGVNPGILTLQLITEPTRGYVLTGTCICCDKCPIVLLSISNLDAQYDPFAITQRVAPGREMRISSPVWKVVEGPAVSIRVDDPTSIEFPVVRPRCFSIGCDSAGSMLKCGGCLLTTYCSKVGMGWET